MTSRPPRGSAGPRSCARSAQPWHPARGPDRAPRGAPLASSSAPLRPSASPSSQACIRSAASRAATVLAIATAFRGTHPIRAAKALQAGWLFAPGPPVSSGPLPVSSNARTLPTSPPMTARPASASAPWVSEASSSPCRRSRVFARALRTSDASLRRVSSARSASRAPSIATSTTVRRARRFAFSSPSLFQPEARAASRARRSVGRPYALRQPASSVAIPRGSTDLAWGRRAATPPV